MLRIWSPHQHFTFRLGYNPVRIYTPNKQKNRGNRVLMGKTVINYSMQKARPREKLPVPKFPQGYFSPTETSYSCKHYREVQVNTSIMSLSDDMIRNPTERSHTYLKSIMKNVFNIPAHFSYFIWGGNLGFSGQIWLLNHYNIKWNNHGYIHWVCLIL